MAQHTTKNLYINYTQYTFVGKVINRNYIGNTCTFALGFSIMAAESAHKLYVLQINAQMNKNN